MNNWLVKSPYKNRSWPEALIKGIFRLYGIRNYQAASNIKTMMPQDRALFYHNSKGRKIFGVMVVNKSAYKDPTTANERWVAIDFKPLNTFNNPVTLESIKKEPLLKNIALLRQPRLSVMQLTKEEYDKILEMGNEQ